MKSTTFFLFITVVFLPNFSSGAFCTYYRNSNRVTCGSVTCNAASTTADQKLPAGYYYVGNFYHHSGVTPWFNLYRQKAGTTDFWDYYTKVPELGCRGGFGLHSGTRSLGCVTVTDDNCFRRLQSEITNNYPIIYFDVKECRGCSSSFFGGYSCWFTSNVRRPCTTDLQSI